MPHEEQVCKARCVPSLVGRRSDRFVHTEPNIISAAAPAVYCVSIPTACVTISMSCCDGCDT
eukprot:2159669-Pleurochrysis_carterae.AAC.1